MKKDKPDTKAKPSKGRRMDTFYAPWTGVIVSTEDFAEDEADVTAAARAWLDGHHGGDADFADFTSAVGQTWFVDDEIGFAQATHPGAQPCWTVTLPQSYYRKHGGYIH